MQQNCYLKHPTKNEMVNVVQNPHLCSGDLPLLIKNVKAQMTEYDRYDSENDRALQTCILGSIDSDLSMQVSGLSDMADGALVTWIKIVREWSIMTNEKKTAIMKHIEGTTIQSFQGMNVSTAVEQLKPLCASLVNTRDYDPLLLESFLMSLHSAFDTNSPEHLTWWGDIHKLVVRVQDVCAAQKMHQQKGPCQTEDNLLEQTETDGPDKGLDYVSILNYVLDKYQVLVHRGKWPAANTPRDKGAAPPAFGAASVHLSEANALLQNFDSVKAKRPLRPHAGRPRPPGKTTSSSATVRTSNKSGKPGSSRPSKFNNKKNTNWKQVPPTSGAPHTKTNSAGKVWYWCGKCNFGKGRWTASHTTTEHGTRPKTTPTAANLAGITPCAWYAAVPNTLSSCFVGLCRAWILLLHSASALYECLPWFRCPPAPQLGIHPIPALH